MNFIEKYFVVLGCLMLVNCGGRLAKPVPKIKSKATIDRYKQTRQENIALAAELLKVKKELKATQAMLSNEDIIVIKEICSEKPKKCKGKGIGKGCRK